MDLISHRHHVHLLLLSLVMVLVVVKDLRDGLEVVGHFAVVVVVEG